MFAWDVFACVQTSHADIVFYDIDFVRYVLKDREKEVCESFAPDF